jgi:hypothetical protein
MVANALIASVLAIPEVVERFKTEKIATDVTLMRGERSELS